MIVLGDKYKFSKHDLDKLNKKFHAITQIPYKDKNVKEVINKIENVLKKEKDKKVIVLNTGVVIPDELITYLTRLELNGIKFLSMKHFLEKYLHKCYIPDDHTELDFLEDIKPYSKWQYLQKRVIDFFGIFWLFFFFWPVMGYCAYRIKKESPDGPIIFRQKRVGKDGKEFVCVKFRSMVPDAENGKPQFASENDSRVFKWGAFMRKARIDELPQLWNVPKGEMHLIGPRPERKYWVDHFEKLIPYYNQRHVVAPGITGWAQVNYPYGSSVEDAKEKLMYDLYYIKHWTLWLDLKIVWKTILTILSKKGR